MYFYFTDYRYMIRDITGVLFFNFLKLPNKNLMEIE